LAVAGVPTLWLLRGGRPTEPEANRRSAEVAETLEITRPS
jgi:hypothetical protein